MSDDHNKNYRTAPGDIAEDDPLAELARIIGYDRPKEARPQVDAPQTVPDLDVFDLEAELMRELDQTQFDEPEGVTVEAPEDEPVEAAHTAPEPMAVADTADERLGEDIAELIAQADVAEELPEAQDLASDQIDDILGDEDFVLNLDQETDDADVSPVFAPDVTSERAEPLAQDTSDAQHPVDMQQPSDIPDRDDAQDPAQVQDLPSSEAETSSELDYSSWDDDDDGVDFDSPEAAQPQDETLQPGDDTNSIEQPVVAEDDFSLEDIELDEADREKVEGFVDRFYADDDDVLADMERVSRNGNQNRFGTDDDGALSALTTDREAQPDDADPVEEHGFEFLDAEATEAESDTDRDPSLHDDVFDPDIEFDLAAQTADEADFAGPAAGAGLPDPDADGEDEQIVRPELPADAVVSETVEAKTAATRHYIDFEDELSTELDVYQQELDLADVDAALTESYMGSGVPSESLSIETDDDPAFAAAADDFVESGVAAEELPELEEAELEASEPTEVDTDGVELERAELDEAELDAQFAAWTPAATAVARDHSVDDVDEDADETGFDFDLGPELEQALASSIDGDVGVDGVEPAADAGNSTNGDAFGDEDSDVAPFEVPAGILPLIAADDLAEDETAEFDAFEFDDLWVSDTTAQSSGPDSVELELDVSELDVDDWDEDSSLEEQADEGLPAPDQIDRDETASEFLDLLSEPAEPGAAMSVADTTPDVDADSGSEGGDEADLPAASAWLGGMSVRASSSNAADACDADTENMQAGEGGFDPAALVDADYGLEQIGEFDVPSIPHDDPVQQADAESGFEADIEREFAQLVDAEMPNAYTVPETAIAGMAASAAAWPGVAKASDETIPDDYYDLESNLDSKPNGDYADDEFTVRSDREPVDDVYRPDAEEPLDARGSRGPFLALLVLGIAVVGGLGAFGWSMFSGEDASGSGGPRIILADKEPVKVVPENPGGLVVPNQEKAVYETVDGGDVSKPTQPNLVTSAEEPVDVVQRTLDPSFLPLEGESEGEPVKAEDRLAADETNADDSPIGSGVVVVPRKVRTMVVRPDGTIVAREETDPQEEDQAGQAPAPIAPDSQPVVAAESVAAASEASAVVEATPVAAPDPAVEAAVADPVQVVTTAPNTPPAIAAPVPQARPAQQPVNIVSTVTDRGNVNIPATAPVGGTQAASTPAVDNPGGYYMQIASQPTPEGAQASYKNLSQRFASVIGNRGVQIQRADIPGKGVYHRVRIPAGTRDEANALCSRYKAAGGNCLVSR